jgi:hypothetical protein
MGPAEATVFHGNTLFSGGCGSRYGSDRHQRRESVLLQRLWDLRTNATKYVASRSCLTPRHISAGNLGRNKLIVAPVLLAGQPIRSYYERTYESNRTLDIPPPEQSLH